MMDDDVYIKGERIGFELHTPNARAGGRRAPRPDEKAGIEFSRGEIRCGGTSAASRRRGVASF